MDNLDINLSTIKLEAEKHSLRIPPRKEEQQQYNYKEHFDYNTLFADIFQREDSVELVGPPLLNLQTIFEKCKIKIDGVDYDTSKMRIYSIHRKCRVILPNITNAKIMEIDYDGETFVRDIQPNAYDFFESCNVMVTQQKDNPIEWIAYWVAYHIEHHKIDSIVIYDNDSTLYTNEELKRVLSKIQGLKKLAVIDWKIPYGAVGGEFQIWDSDFGQHQSWEHAFNRLLKKANMVLICDIDELILHKDGIALPDALSRIEEPVIQFKRRQIAEIPSCDEYNELPRMHCLTHLYEEKKALYAPKYAFSPTKISPDVHLLVHNVVGDKMLASEEFLGRHFGALRIHWRNDNFTPIPLFTKEEYIQRFKVKLLEDDLLRNSYKGINLDWLNE